MKLKKPNIDSVIVVVQDRYSKNGKQVHRYSKAFTVYGASGARVFKFLRNAVKKAQ